MEFSLSTTGILIIILNSLGIFLAFLVGLLLSLKSKWKNQSIALFAWMLFLAGFTLLNDLLVSSGLASQNSSLYFLPIYFTLAIGPMMYLFIRSKTQGLTTQIFLAHLILPSIQFLIYLFIGFRSPEFKSSLWHSNWFPIYLQLEAILFPCSLILYISLSRITLSKNVQSNYFWSHDIYNWLNLFLKIFTFFVILECTYILCEIGFERLGFAFGLGRLLHSIILVGLLFWITYNGILYFYAPLIYKTKSWINKSEPEGTNWVVDKLQHLMQEDKLYLNPDLDLSLLAHYVGVHKKQISAVINSTFDQNFNQFINGYRVEAVKKKLMSGDHKLFTITAIAYQCGFDSKSTFYRAFKDLLGSTPSEFVKTLS